MTYNNATDAHKFSYDDDDDDDDDTNLQYSWF